jgi:hypothetical protein
MDIIVEHLKAAFNEGRSSAVNLPSKDPDQVFAEFLNNLFPPVTKLDAPETDIVITVVEAPSSDTVDEAPSSDTPVI